MLLSDLGRVVETEWKRIPLLFAHAELDEFQIMPNHLHGIILFTDGPASVGANNPPQDVSSEIRTNMAGYSPSRPEVLVAASKLETPVEGSLLSSDRPSGTVPGSLAAVIQNFKKNTGRVINRIQRTPGKPVWQRNYYEHIVRSEEELERLREYMVLNPARWSFDPENR